MSHERIERARAEAMVRAFGCDSVRKAPDESSAVLRASLALQAGYTPAEVIVALRRWEDSTVSA